MWIVNGIKKRIINTAIAIDKKLSEWKKAAYFTASESIILGSNVYIEDSARIEIKFGGTIKIMDGSYIGHGVYISTYGGNITIGKNSSINAYTIIYGHGGVVIGDDVLIAGHSMIIPNQHIYKDKKTVIRSQGCTARGIIIENDVWVGHGVTIMDNIKIGEGSVIAAGTVVTKNILPYTVNAGVPSEFLKNRQNE